MIIGYKITNSAGLYSTGGTSPSWTKKGKLWTSRGALSNHLNLVNTRIYRGCAISTIEGTETIEDGLLQNLIFNSNKRAAKREDERNNRMNEYTRNRELKELKRLQNKYKSGG